VTFSRYDRYALAVLAVGVATCAALWRWADVLYGGGSRRAGWGLGMLGCTLPALALGAYALWLRHQRAPGQAAAQVRWLNAAVGLAAGFSIVMLLFSLM
jgi:hypothetical protein